MKRLLFPIVIVFVLLYIFIQSNTLEMFQEDVQKEGGALSYTKTRYSLHWDRFVDYSEEIPDRVGRFIKQWTRKF